MIQILDPDAGIEMFDAVRGTSFRPTKVLQEAAVLMIGDVAEGQESREVRRILSKTISVNDRGKSTKVFRHISQGHTRGVDVVRAAFVRMGLVIVRTKSAAVSNKMH